MQNEFVYSLRIGLCPDFYADEKFQDILEFCKEARIDDVQFFINMEEVNQGHLTLEETEEWLQMIDRFKPQLEKEGITVSLNPWTSLLHADRGRTLKPGQDFVLMEDKNGLKATATPCPLDENFHKYIREIYQAYAKRNFNVVWVEDDFRLHNHYPLDFGGCFCELHMKEFAKRIGKEVTAQELVEGMLKEGTPHPYRKVWLDTARDTMSSLAEILGNAIHETAPDTRVALMSSGPQTHSVEGRDWKQIFNNLAGNTRPLNRPHLPAYSEGTAKGYALNFQRYSRLTAATIKGQAELWPELDNLPHTTFAKSHKFAAMEIESALALCAEGITINIYDMIGNGINKAQKNQKMLAPLKPYLNGVKALQTKGEQEQGVCVLFSQNSAYTIHTKDAKDIYDLEPWETFWAEYLSAFGIANHFTDDYKVKGQIVAVSGQYFRNLTPEEIEQLFADNKVLLEGEAADTLLDMGLGHIAGIESAKWCTMNTAFHSYDQAVPRTFYQGLPEARMSAQGMGEDIDYLRIEYADPEVRTLSEMKSPEGKTVGKGITSSEKVVVFPYGPLRYSYSFLLNPVKREMFQELIGEMQDVRIPAMALEHPYIAVNEFMQDERRILLMTNFTTDDCEEPEIRISGEVSEAYEISREDGEQVPVPFEKNGDVLKLSGTLEHMKSRCIILK